LANILHCFIIIIIINEFHRDASLTKTSGPQCVALRELCRLCYHFSDCFLSCTA